MEKESVLKQKIAELELENLNLANENSEFIVKIEALEKALRFSSDESKESDVALYEVRMLIEILAAIDFDELKNTDSVKYFIEIMQEKVG